MAADKTLYNQHVAALKLELIVPIEYLMAASAFDLNIDENKLIFACVNAQKLYLEPMIGSALMRRLQEKPVVAPYDALLTRFLNDAILSWGAAESVRSIAYSLKNGGIYKHLPTDAEPVTASELNTIKQDFLNKADTFACRAVDYLNANSGQYPEYSQWVEDGIKANKTAQYTGGLLIESGGSCNGC